MIECGTFYSTRTWDKGLIEKLVQITHKQWLFQNSHVHYKKLEGLSTLQHEEIFDKVSELMCTDPAELLPPHRHLLEVDFSQMEEGSTSYRMYWTASMESALQAADHIITSKPSMNLHNAMLPKKKNRKENEAQD